MMMGNCTKNKCELLEKIQIELSRIIRGLTVNSSKSNLYMYMEGFENWHFTSNLQQIQLPNDEQKCHSMPPNKPF